MRGLSRRDFLAGAASGIAGVTALTTSNAAAGFSSRVHVIDLANGPYLDRKKIPIDLDGRNACTLHNEKFLETLAKGGIDTIFRYYSDQNNAGLNCKNITCRERDMLHAHGFSIAIVYQFDGRSANRYTGLRAAQDAAFCHERAKIIQQPDGSAIYIGVDQDTGANSDADVAEYFRVMNDALGERFKIGIYAAGARCRLIKEATYRRHGTGPEVKGLASYFWVPEAPAWSGTRDFMRSGDWTLYQNKTEVQRSAFARDMGQEVKLDTDFVNPRAGNTIGAFKSDNSIATYDQQRLEAIARKRYWVKPDRMELSERPDGPATKYMCIARMVHVLNSDEELARDNDWARVDIDEDGIEDGVCLRRHLAPLADMPQWGPVCTPMPP